MSTATFRVFSKDGDFVCRICGAKSFDEKYENNGILGPGGKSFRIYCFCSGCSVVFLDPEKFSLK